MKPNRPNVTIVSHNFHKLLDYRSYYVAADFTLTHPSVSHHTVAYNIHYNNDQHNPPKAQMVYLRGERERYVYG